MKILLHLKIFTVSFLCLRIVFINIKNCFLFPKLKLFLVTQANQFRAIPLTLQLRGLSSSEYYLNRRKVRIFSPIYHYGIHERQLLSRAQRETHPRAQIRMRIRWEREKERSAIRLRYVSVEYCVVSSSDISWKWMTRLGPGNHSSFSERFVLFFLLFPNFGRYQGR